jgi:type VI protein secretion system component Hcp
MVLKKTMKLMLAVLAMVMGTLVSPTRADAATTTVTLNITGVPGIDAGTPITLVGYQSKLAHNGNKPEFVDVSFTKGYDSTSQALATAALEGRHINRLVFTFSRTGGNVLVVTLTDVRLSVITNHTIAAADVPIEQVNSLVYDRIQWEYRAPKPDGTLGPVVKSGWDVKTNKAF